MTGEQSYWNYDCLAGGVTFPARLAGFIRRSCVARALYARAVIHRVADALGGPMREGRALKRPEVGGSPDTAVQQERDMELAATFPLRRK